MQGKRVSIFLGLSLLIHVFVLIIIFSNIIQSIFKQPAPVKKQNKVVVKLVEPPPKPQQKRPQETIFADAAQSQPTDKPIEDTFFEGERDTLASSRTPTQGNEFMPTLDGIEQQGLDIMTTPHTPEIQSQAAADQPVTKPTEEPQIEQKKVEESPKQPSFKDKVAFRTDSLVTLKPEPEEEKQDKKEEIKEVIPGVDPSQAQAPSSSYMPELRANKMGGAAPNLGTDSLAIKGSSFGLYKAKLWRAVGSLWYSYIHEHPELYSIGAVKIKFFVSSDGIIKNMQIVSGREYQLLSQISLRSIREVSGQLEPFSEQMKLQLGEGYVEEMSFSIY
ncbi:MAG: hypothetical protein AAF984_07165 [Verrucomicrobiota bacterium]